jgi:hypothetical protein
MEDKVYSILKKLEYLEEKMNDLNVNIEDVEEINQFTPHTSISKLMLINIYLK